MACISDGSLVGNKVGSDVGMADGIVLGCTDGSLLGDAEGRLLDDGLVSEGPLISSAYTGQIFSAQTGDSILREIAIFSVVLSDGDLASSTAGSVFRTT